MSQIRLVADQHDNDVRVSVLAHLAQPPRDALVGAVLGDVVQQQCAHGAAVVGGSDGPVAFLSSSVPNLGLCVIYGKKETVSICRVHRPIFYTLFPLACLLFVLIIVVDLITSDCAEKDIYIFFFFFPFPFCKQWDDEVYHVGFLSLFVSSSPHRCPHQHNLDERR